MSIPVGTIAALALSTGAVTALLNQILGGVFAARRDKAARQHATTSQQIELAHNRDMQQDEAHAAARAEFVADVAGVAEWITYNWGLEWGMDADYVIDNEPPPSLHTPTEVIAALRRLEYQHPTSRVREIAGELDGSIGGHYGSIVYNWNEDARLDVPSLGGTPSDDDFRMWHGKAERLIEALHTPPSLMRPLGNTEDATSPASAAQA